MHTHPSSRRRVRTRNRRVRACVRACVGVSASAHSLHVRPCAYQRTHQYDGGFACAHAVRKAVRMWLRKAV
eukprot:624787-Pleurochrysis_carterae.AAC.1